MLSRARRISSHHATLGESPASPTATGATVAKVFVGYVAVSVAVLGVAYLVSLALQPRARAAPSILPRRPGAVLITEIPVPVRVRTRSGYRKVDTERLMPVSRSRRRRGNRVRVPLYVQPEPGWNKK